MSTYPPLPIEVTGTPVPTAVLALARYVLVIAVTFAVGQGWLDAESTEGVIALGIALFTLGYGIYRTWENKRRLIVAADAAPNSVAVVK